MKEFDAVIQNALVVTSKTQYRANLYISDGKFSAITAPETTFPAARSIDAGGKPVIPGCVDGHSHLMDPGYTDRETFITGTMAAAAGGYTTVTDHHRTIPAVYSVEPLLEKIEYLKDRAVVDFALMGGLSPDNQKELRAMWDAGVTSFKGFTCNLHGVQAMHSGYLLDTFRTIASFGGRALIHAEDNGIIAFEEERMKREGRKDPMAHFEGRSKLAEEIAVQTVLSLAKSTGANVGIAHVSQPHLAEMIRRVQEEGYPVFSETEPHYLSMNTEDLKRLGPWLRFTPPVNTPEMQEKLWELFDKGIFDTMGTDHCPIVKADKEKGLEDVLEAPCGIPGLETALKLMLTGVNSGKTTLNRLVACMCENPAKIYGLYPKKGAIQVGTDADLVILDMEKEETLCNEKVISKCGWTPYVGMTVKGGPDTVMVRGQIVFAEGKVIGKPGWGAFVPRQS